MINAPGERAPAWMRLASRYAPVSSRVVMSVVYGLVIAAQLVRAAHAGINATGLHWLLASALTMLFLAGTLRRASPIRRGSAVGGLIAISAPIWIVTLGVMRPAAHPSVALIVTSVTLSLGGLGFAVIAAGSLGACFGWLPDARGLVTSGPYRLCRHPLYLGEVTSALGVALALRRLDIALAVWCCLVGVQLARAWFEEQTLRAAFVDYAAYAQRTARLVPFVL